MRVYLNSKFNACQHRQDCKSQIEELETLNAALQRVIDECVSPTDCTREEHCIPVCPDCQCQWDLADLEKKNETM